MDNEQKAWLSGCGCGCATLLVLFPLVGGIWVGASYMLWEVGEVRHELVEGPAALAIGAVLGLLAGAVAGTIGVFVVRKVMLSRLARRRPDPPSPPA